MCVYVSRDDIVGVLVCGTSWMTGSCRGCSCRDVNVLVLTHGGFLDYRYQRSARKHRYVLSHCQTVRSTLCVTTRSQDSSRYTSMNGLLNFHTIFRHDFATPQICLAEPPSSCVAVAWMDCHSCARCTTSGKEPVCHDLSQQQALFTASQHSGSPDFYVARHVCTPS